MKQIIELAQKELAAQENILMNLEQDKEYALNEALKRQSEIPVQKEKVKQLSDDLNKLYERYGYPGGQSGCASISPTDPWLKKKSAKPYSKDDED